MTAAWHVSAKPGDTVEVAFPPQVGAPSGEWSEIYRVTSDCTLVLESSTHPSDRLPNLRMPRSGVDPYAALVESIGAARLVIRRAGKVLHRGHPWRGLV